ncbi:MAG: hypothetical protein ACREJO_01650 [Phycisphaerales bacterium]
MPFRLRAPITCLALGLLTSVAIAWIAASTPATLDGDAERLQARGLDSRRRTIVELSLARRTTLFGTRTSCKLTGAATPVKITVFDQPLPGWARQAAEPWLTGRRITPPDEYCDARMICATGFPFRCAQYTYTLPQSVPSAWLQTTRGVAAGAFEIARSTGTPTRLPFIPIWPGLLLNTLCFATTWWLIHAIAAQARRSRRHRRNLCLNCGYPRAGLTPAAPCPECGKA